MFEPRSRALSRAHAMPRRAPAAAINPAEAAYRRFLAQQKDGLQAWARKRATLLDEVGMSADMEMIVVDLLEDLREEPAALVHAAADVHAGTHALLLRACLELRFVERHAKQAIAIVLAREGGGLDGGLSIIQRPSLLSDCLDWLCVHVDVDELPLQFRPKLRRARPPAPKLPGGATIDHWSGGAPRTGESSGSVVGRVANSNSSAAVEDADDDDDEPPDPMTLPWTCAACTFDNGGGSTRCEMCSAPRPPPPPPTAEELAKRAKREERKAAELAASEAEAASRAVVQGQLKRLASFGFVRPRCKALLEASDGVEETALAGLVRETIERLTAAAGVEGSSELLAPSTDESEQSELTEIAEEEVEALSAILETEFTRLPSGCIQLTLLWDASTGEAPWSFSAAHLAEEDTSGSQKAAPKRSLCSVCVVPGCKLPTNKHKQSAYCTLAHAQHDEAQATPFYFATVAGYKPDGSPLDIADPLIDRPDAESLQSLELYVCTNAAKPHWPYPRAPPLVAVRCSQLLPRAQLELTRVVLKHAIKLAADNAASGAPAPMLYELLSWFRSELPTLLQRLAVVVAKPPAGSANDGVDDDEEEEEESSKPKLTAAEAAAVARNSLVQRTWLESEAQREREEEEAAERRRRWEQVKELIRQEEAEKAAAKAADAPATSEEGAREPSPSQTLPGIGSGSRGGGGGGRGASSLGRGRVGRGRGDVLWPDFKQKAAAVITTAAAAEAAESAPAASDPPAAATAAPPPPPEEDTASAAASLAPVPLYAATPEQLAPPILTTAQERESRTLLDAHERKRKSNEYARMAAARSKLPAATKRADVLAALERNAVLVVSGETGCGKTTQVPQFILDDAIENHRGAAVNIICTQPRRISAMGVATRVAAERCEPLGQTVGYQIRLESKRSHMTRLLFCTTGVLLRRLHGDGELKGVSHVIIDEVHERSLQSDFLLIILKEVLRVRPSLRIVLMSATINANLFSNYFGAVPPPLIAAAAATDDDDATLAAQQAATAATPTQATAATPAPTLHIPGFTHPVTEYWLEDVLTMTGHMIEVCVHRLSPLHPPPSTLHLPPPSCSPICECSRRDRPTRSESTRPRWEAALRVWASLRWSHARPTFARCGRPSCLLAVPSLHSAMPL